ncbi:oxygen-insensitive NADPH nitroreductase [Fusibacter bizertensis]
MNQTLELMLSHRSIRKFTDQLVNERELDIIIRAAQAAATSSFLQAYSIIDVKNPEIRAKLRTFCGDQEYVEKSPIFLVFCGDTHRIKNVCDSSYESGWTETFIIATVDAAIAGQNAMLAAESLGLGGVYIGGIRNHAQEVSDLLKLPEEVYPVFGMCLGYPAQDPEVKERLPKEIVYHVDHYTELDEATLEAYDTHISDYYIKRTKGKIKDTWSEAVSKKFKQEKREHMLKFLQDRGFIKK